MGSKFFDLHLADPQRVHALLRGDHPEIVRGYASRAEAPPGEALWPAFEVMARGTFVFLPRQVPHADGATYGRAVEYVLRDVGEKRWGIEFYPDESVPVWGLVFDPCEAPWLTLPASTSGVPAIAWRSSRTCYGRARVLAETLASGEFNPRYISADSLSEVIGALEEGSRSGHGLFAIYQE